MRNGIHVGSLLPERAPSEGPRSTAAVEPNMGVVPRWRYERAWMDHCISGRWTRAVGDQSAPIPEEITNELGEMGNLVVLLLAERAPSEGWRGRCQVPFLLAERAR